MAYRRSPVTLGEIRQKGLENVISELENNRRNQNAIMSDQERKEPKPDYAAAAKVAEQKQKQAREKAGDSPKYAQNVAPKVTTGTYGAMGQQREQSGFSGQLERDKKQREQQQKAWEEEQRAGARAEYYRAMDQRQKDEETLQADIDELNSWTEEDREAIRRYVAKTDTEAFDMMNPAMDTWGRTDYAETMAKPLFDKYGRERVLEIAESYRRHQNEQNREKTVQAGTEAAEERPVLASAGSVAANLASGMTGIPGYIAEGMSRTGRYSTLDPNNAGQVFGTWGGAVREETARRIGESWAGDVGATVYQGAMSAADSLARTLMLGPAGAATLAATDSAARTISEASRQGASPAQAVTLGIATAGIEYLTEKIPMERLFKAAKGGAKGAGAFIKEVLKQGGIEAATEEISLLGSMAAEAVILGERDSSRQRIGDLVANGMSYQEAREQVSRENWDEAVQTFAVSFTAGAFGAGAGQVLGNRANRQETQPQQQQTQTPQSQAVQTEPKTAQQRLMETMAPIAQNAPRAETDPETERASRVAQGMLSGIVSPQAVDTQEQSVEGGQRQVEQWERDNVEGIRQVIRDVESGMSQQELREKSRQYEAEYERLQSGGTEGERMTAHFLYSAYDSAAKNPQATAQMYRDAMPQLEADIGIKGTGAAEANFSGKRDFYDLLGEDNMQPDRATDVRPMEMIRTDAQGRNVSDTAGNLYGAGVTSDDMADEIQKLAAIGALSFDRRSNREAMAAAAEEIKRKGRKATEREITNRAMNGKPKEGDIEKGMLLYAEYVRKGDIDSASEMAVDLATLGHRAGRDLQLFKLLRMMTPEGQLLTVQKGVQRAINNINRGRSKGNQIENVEISNELQSEYLEASRDVLDPRRAASQYAVSKISEASTDLAEQSATTAVSDYLGSFKESDKKANIATNDLVDRIGQRVADNLTRQAQEQNVSVEDVLYQDIMRFVNDKVNAGSGRRTEQTQENRNLRALADYHRYQPFFQNAWNSARSRVEAAMAQMPDGDPRVDIIEDFLATYSIENRDVIAGHEFGNASSTVRRAAKEAANMAGVRMENAGNRQTQTARREMIDVLRQNTTRKRAAANRIAAIAVDQLGLEGRAAEQLAEDITDAFYADLAERSSREIQRILTPKVVTEKAKKSLAQKLGELYNLGAMDTDVQTRQAIFDTVFGEGSGIDVDTGLLEQYVNAAEQKRAEIEREIYLQIGSQIKATFAEKWNAWRYMAMLGNAKTQLRNFAGNAMWMPYKAAKDTMAAAAESFLLPKSQRTKAVLNMANEADRKLLDWAKQDAKSGEVSDALKYSAKLGDDMTRNRMDEGRRIFNTEALERVRKFVESVPQKGDMLFKNPHYANSLAGFLKARGYTVQQVQNGEVSAEIMTEARSYAIEEAMKATFNDSNAFSDAVSNLRYRGDNVFLKVANIMGEGVLPFRRTPANILVRFTEYSPVGLAKTAWDAATKLRNGDMSAAAVIDELAAGLTGSVAMTLGFFLAKGIAGFKLRGSNTDDDEKRQGHQDYALEFSIDGQEYSYKIDWAAPANLPLFLGANLYEIMSGKGQDTSVSAFTGFVYNLGNMFEPMLALSCLSGLNDLFESAQYAREGGSLYAAAAQIATGYFTQGIPALLRQSAQASQEVKQSTFANSQDPLLRDIGREAANIPYLDRIVDLKTDAVNAWGEKEVEENGLIRAFHAYLNPGTLKQIDNSELEKEVMRLNEAMPDSVSPKDTPKAITYTDKNGQRHQNHRLTEEEYQTLATTQGQTAADMLNSAIKNPAYKAMTDAQKAKVFEYVYDYAREKGRAAALEGYDGMAEWMKEVSGKDPAAIIRRVASAAMDDSISGSDAQQLSQAYKVYQGMSAAQKDAFREDAAGRVKYYLEAKDAGIKESAFLNLYKKYREIDGNGKKAGQKTDEWAFTLDKAWQNGTITREQAEALKASMVFRTSLTADSEKYDEMVSAGVNPETAFDVSQLLAGIKPYEGSDAVKPVQKYEAIAESKYTDAEKDLIMKAYMPDYDPTDESPDRTELKYDTVRDLGYSPEEYAEIYAAYLDADKKAQKIAAIQRLGYSYTQAQMLYSIFEGGYFKGK